MKEAEKTMTPARFVTLGGPRFDATRDALHGYARILGNVLKQSRPKRKHWWHASLRPALRGLTTGVVHADVDFELELNLRDSTLLAYVVTGESLTLALHGQPVNEVISRLGAFLAANGVPSGCLPAAVQDEAFDTRHADYSVEQANALAQGLSAVAGAMAVFRAGIREETSPIQLWPHHFDLSMLWLPGQKISGQDPDDEEYSDQQMNFGFTFGDGGIPEPYFYVTAYPLPDSLPSTPLPAGASWHSEGFNGVVLRYRTLCEAADPHALLPELWSTLLRAGRKALRSDAEVDTQHS